MTDESDGRAESTSTSGGVNVAYVTLLAATAALGGFLFGFDET